MIEKVVILKRYTMYFYNSIAMSIIVQYNMHMSYTKLNRKHNIGNIDKRQEERVNILMLPEKYTSLIVNSCRRSF